MDDMPAASGPRSAPHSQMRIGDAERQRVAEQLRVAYADGRLTETELEERLATALAAKTGADLVPVTADLQPVAAPQFAAPARRAWRFDPRILISMFMPAIICTAIYLMTTPGGYFWPMWVWFGMAIPAAFGFIGGIGGIGNIGCDDTADTDDTDNSGEDWDDDWD